MVKAIDQKLKPNNIGVISEPVAYKLFFFKKAHILGFIFLLYLDNLALLIDSHADCQFLLISVPSKRVRHT